MTAADPLAWLLEPENPAVRYLTLTRVMQRTETDPEASAARAAIPDWGPARAILDAQWPEGYWVNPGVGYSPRHKATVWQIVFWEAIGGPAIDAIKRACAHVLAHSRLPDGRFSAHKTARGAMLCLNGNLLRAMARLGCDDPRLKEVCHSLITMVVRDSFCCRVCVPGTDCCTPLSHARDGEPCTWGVVKVLGALAAVADTWCTGTVQAAIEAGVDLLVGEIERIADCWQTTLGAPWLDFGFPQAQSSDLLEALEVLAAHRVAREPQLVAAAHTVRARQTEGGPWLLDTTPRNTWSAFGQVGRPSKWVTLRALCALRYWEAPA